MYNKKEIKVTSTQTKNKNPWSKDKIVDPRGQWAYPGENTRIPSNNITMEGVPYPVIGVPNMGTPVMMMPGEDYNFPGADYVDEYPMAEEGIHIKKSNLGKFTAKAQAAGMGVQEYASKVLSAPEGKYDPSTRKQANFARNASKWRKQEGGPIEVYQGSDQWDAYQAQQAKVDAYNKWKSEHEGVISQGLTPHGTFAKNPLSGEAAPQGYAGFMRYKTPIDKRVPDNKWNWSAETVNENTSYNYAPYMAAPENLVDYKVVESPTEFDQRLRNEYLTSQNIVGYKRTRNYNAVSGENNYEYTPVRKGEEIDTTNFVTPDKVDQVLPSFQTGGPVYGENPNEFERGEFNVMSSNLNAPFVNQQGFNDYSQYVENKPHYVDAMNAYPFATFRANPYDEGTKDFKKTEKQNIRDIKQTYRQSKKHWRDVNSGNANPIDVFADGGQYKELELTDYEIQDLRRRGYRVDEL